MRMAKKMMERVLVVPALLLCCSACTVGPDYVRPDVPMPAAYGEASGTPEPMGSSVATDGSWWQRYGDAQLDTLVRQLDLHNQSLKAAAARVDEADALLRAAGGTRVPSVTAGTVTSGISGRKDFGAQVVWELDLWGRMRRDVEARGADAAAAADDLAAATLSMRAQVVASYFALRAKDAGIELLQAATTVNGRWLQIVRNRHALGVASSGELAQAHLQLADAQGQLASTRLERTQIEHAIATLVGKPPADFSIAPSPLPLDTKVPVIPAHLPSRLLERRPDIAAAERRVASASARIGVRQAEMLPSLDLGAGIGVLRGAFGAADLAAPLYRGGTLEAGVSGARASYAEALAQYRQTVLDGFREVEDNLAAQRLLRSQTGIHEDAAKVAGDALRISANQYKAGVADYELVVQARAELVKSHAAAVELLRRRLTTSVNLIKALGGGWEMPAPTRSAGGARR